MSRNSLESQSATQIPVRRKNHRIKHTRTSMQAYSIDAICLHYSGRAGLNKSVWYGHYRAQVLSWQVLDMFSLLEYCNILHIKICNKRYQPKTDVLSAEIWQRKCHVIICNQRWHLKNCCLIFKKMTTHTTHQNLLSKITPQKLLSYPGWGLSFQTWWQIFATTFF